MQNELLAEHEVARPGGDLNEPMEHGIVARHNAHAGLAAPFQQGHGIELLVIQEGEGLLPGDDHGRQERGDLGVKIAL